MTALDTPTTARRQIDDDSANFVEEAALDAAHGVRTLRSTGTLPAGSNIEIVERIPGTRLAVRFTSSEPWAGADAALDDLDIIDLASPSGLSTVLAGRPELTTIAYVDSPYLAAWAQTGRSLPIRYVPVQRWTLVSELPIHVGDDLAAFIVAHLSDQPHTPAALDAGGGAAVWGGKGLLATLEYLQVIEEGAQFQILAESLGGSQPVGPGVLAQQWKMSGLEAQARAAGLLD